MKTSARDTITRLLPFFAVVGAWLITAPPTMAADAVVIPKFMKLIIPYSPGGSTDVFGRNIAAVLGERLGNTVIVEHRPGAGATIGTDAVAKSVPDGSTLLLTTTAFTISAGVQEKLPYDPITDLAPIAMITEVPMILAVPASSPYKSTADLINAARAEPGKLNYGSSGIGSSNHMAMELFKTAGKLQITHVPYKGMAPAAIDLSSGRVQAIIGSYPSLTGALQSGKVRALAVSSSAASPFWPDLPPISAALPGYGMTAWFAMFVPGRTPPALIELLHKEIRGIITTERFSKFLALERAAASTMDLPTLNGVIRTEIAQWKRIAAEQKIKAE